MKYKGSDVLIFTLLHNVFSVLISGCFGCFELLAFHNSFIVVVITDMKKKQKNRPFALNIRRQDPQTNTVKLLMPLEYRSIFAVQKYPVL